MRGTLKTSTLESKFPLLAVEGKCVTSAEGIIDDDVDRSIRNLTAIGREGMAATDRLVLDIMTHKKPADCGR